MKWIIQDGLVFSMYHGKVCGISFSAYDDGIYKFSWLDEVKREIF